MGPLVDKVGLYGLLGCTVVTLTASLLCAERAYHISSKFGFDPGLEIKEQQAKKALQKEEAQQVSLVSKAQTLFARVPTLKALFCEVLSFQCMSTILNVCLVGTLKTQIPADIERAAWTGRFYATINAVSALFQFVLMPLGMNKVPPNIAWRIMPILPVVACVCTALQSSPSLQLLAIAFFSAKCLDYSLRGVVTEMVYVPLDFESRYVGKELVCTAATTTLGLAKKLLLLALLTHIFLHTHRMGCLVIAWANQACLYYLAP